MHMSWHQVRESPHEDKPKHAQDSTIHEKTFWVVRNVWTIDVWRSKNAAIGVKLTFWHPVPWTRVYTPTWIYHFQALGSLPLPHFPQWIGQRISVFMLKRLFLLARKWHFYPTHPLNWKDINRGGSRRLFPYPHLANLLFLYKQQINSRVSAEKRFTDLFSFQTAIARFGAARQHLSHLFLAILFYKVNPVTRPSTFSLPSYTHTLIYTISTHLNQSPPRYFDAPC